MGMIFPHSVLRTRRFKSQWEPSKVRHRAVSIILQTYTVRQAQWAREGSPRRKPSPRRRQSSEYTPWSQNSRSRDHLQVHKGSQKGKGKGRSMGQGKGQQAFQSELPGSSSCRRAEGTACLCAGVGSFQFFGALGAPCRLPCGPASFCDRPIGRGVGIRTQNSDQAASPLGQPAIECAPCKAQYAAEWLACLEQLCGTLDQQVTAKQKALSEFKDAEDKWVKQLEAATAAIAGATKKEPTHRNHRLGDGRGQRGPRGGPCLAAVYGRREDSCHREEFARDAGEDEGASRSRARVLQREDAQEVQNRQGRPPWKALLGCGSNDLSRAIDNAQMWPRCLLHSVCKQTDFVSTLCASFFAVQLQFECRGILDRWHGYPFSLAWFSLVEGSKTG